MKSEDHRAEFFALACVLLKMIISVCQSKAVESICRRLTLLSGAAWLPSSGHGNTPLVAALMNMTESGVKTFSNRNNLPVLKPGDERIYHLPDLVKSFERDPDEKLRPRSARKSDINLKHQKPRRCTS